MVRCGIALYGSLPATLANIRSRLRPVLSLRTRIAAVKQVPAGAYVGYDQRHCCPTPTSLATCPIGYNDGYPFRMTNRGTAIVRGRRVPVVGSVTMDYITIDVGHAPGVRVGDEVTLIGRDGDLEVTLDEVSELAETIPYEVTCRLGRRVHRVYMDSEALGFTRDRRRSGMRSRGRQLP
jgi:alanine racemase